MAGQGIIDPALRDFYERIRKKRNVVAHLHIGNGKIDTQNVVKDILDSYKLMFPTESWVDFRKRYMISTGEYDYVLDYEDGTHSRFMDELELAIEILDDEYVRSFFGYNKKQGGLICPNCMSLRHGRDDREPVFAQFIGDNRIRCIACSMDYTLEEYEQKRSEID